MVPQDYEFTSTCSTIKLTGHYVISYPIDKPDLSFKIRKGPNSIDYSIDDTLVHRQP